MKTIIAALAFLLLVTAVKAEDGYDLWLRYQKIDNPVLLSAYKKVTAKIHVSGNSPTMQVIKEELRRGLSGLLGTTVTFRSSVEPTTSLLIGTAADLDLDYTLADKQMLRSLGNEGFIISYNKWVSNKTIITANTETGLLYGTFHLLRMMQTERNISNIDMHSVPRVSLRILDHWDNLNRTVERGYAGISIWNWHLLPGYIDQRYIDYARADASVGINGTVLTNVNANALTLTPLYLEKVKALADIFRPYGIKVYLTARFSAPVEIGGLKTADPLNEEVQQWWKDKANEIYKLVPDFGGFLVKANSEGQPGPQTYGRTHADGANMLADAVGPHGGIVMWRAFVYDVRVQKSAENFDSMKVDKSAESIASADRFKQAFLEFKPLDGQFRKNVIIQVKNGPIDFQPREPFSPLFGAMKQTPLMMEFQLTQEYLGQGTHLVYEAPLFKETLDADTYTNGKGTTVAKVLEGSANNSSLSGMAAVANIGNERNWTNHPFGQANWYAYGRLAWDHTLSAEQIAEEWVRQTFTNNINAVRIIENMMLKSREAVVNYMTPLGLHHIMATGHHYGPGPWVSNLGRADWNPVYYHRADAAGIGFDRTATGSNALAQYAKEVQLQWNDPAVCNEKFLLWFHHVPWDWKMKSGRTLWNELCVKYQEGVDTVLRLQQEWKSVSSFIDPERFQQVTMLLNIQEQEAEWWRNACLLYFSTFSKMPVPDAVKAAGHTLDYYQNLKFPLAPGIGGNN
ncbi:MAG: alpha-glucuronidase family glycosyl hydrolase [Chitinophagaceae bacterium]